MTKLEEEMFFAINEFGPKDGGITSDNDFDKELKRQARAAAEVCKGYIERAFDAGKERGIAEEVEDTCGFIQDIPDKSDWLKSEGITE